MDYTNEFNGLLQCQSHVTSGKMFILKNDKPKTIKVFPNSISKILINQYFDKLKLTTQGRTFVPFIPDEIQKSTFQVLSTSLIDLWNPMLEARNTIDLINTPGIEVSDYNCDGNTILSDLQLDNNEHIYFLTIYRSVAAWFRNNVLLSKKENGEFHEIKGNALMLTPYVDAVIYRDRCYIINELNFNRIFKYDEVIKNQVEEHETEIMSMEFINDANGFMQYIHNSTNAMKAMAKVFLQKRLDKIKKFSSDFIRQKIESQPLLDFIKFDSNNKIIIDDKSSKAVIDILRGVINIDLITGDLNGVD